MRPFVELEGLIAPAEMDSVLKEVDNDERSVMTQAGFPVLVDGFGTPLTDCSGVMRTVPAVSLLQAPDKSG